MIRQLVRVDRSRKPSVAVNATGCKIRTGHEESIKNTVGSLSGQGEGVEEIEVFLFCPEIIPGESLSALRLEDEYKKRDLEAVDAYTLMALYERDPRLTIHIPFATQWKNSQGHWYSMYFVPMISDPIVFVTNRHGPWEKKTWFAGIRKEVK